MGVGPKNFYVLHRAGRTFFAKNFQGDVLDQSFCKTLLGEDIREVTSPNNRIVYKEVGDFIFVAHCDFRVGSGTVQAILRDIVGICELLFGSYQYWDHDTFDLSGAQDIISMYFSKATNDPGVAVGGMPQIFLDSDIIERLDKLLAFLESQEGVCGNGTMLVLGESVLHSRMSLQDTRTILQYHKARSLGAATMRYTPVYTSGAWHNLYAVRISNYVLFVTCFIDKPYSLIERKIEEFHTTLIQSRLEIPTEEPPVLLRQFAKRETLAMLYHNFKTGATVFPALRPGPEVQQKEILDAFWGFFGDASAALQTPGVTEFSACRDAYRFHAKSEGIHKLYVLLANESSGSDVRSIVSDIFKNLRQVQ